MACPKENDISILIPSYKRPQMTVEAIKCALSTGAGEIIVSEDDPTSKLKDYLENIKDPRLLIVIQPKNLGLWKNHLALLHLATKPWIKFLQTDDFITPDCLKIMCSEINEETSIVSALPIYRNLNINKDIPGFSLEQSRRWSSLEYQKRLAWVGNELGRPSNSLVRKNVFDLSEKAWSNNKSCDLIFNIIAATKGEVVLMPPGTCFTGIHPNQDGATQNFKLSFQRLINSLTYIKEKDIPELDTFISVNGFVEGLAMIRSFLARIKRGQNPFYLNLIIDILKLIRLINYNIIVREWKTVKKFYSRKFSKTSNRYLDSD